MDENKLLPHQDRWHSSRIISSTIVLECKLTTCSPPAKAKQSKSGEASCDAKSVLALTCLFLSGSKDFMGAAMASLVSEHVSHPHPRSHSAAPKSCRNTNPRTDRETAAGRAPLTALEALGAVRVVAFGVSGAAGLCIKRQRYPGVRVSDERGGTSPGPLTRRSATPAAMLEYRYIQLPEILLRHHFIRHRSAARRRSDMVEICVCV